MRPGLALALLLARAAAAQDGGTVFLHGIPLVSELPAGAKPGEARLKVSAQAEAPLFVKRRGGATEVDLAAAAAVSDAPLPRHKAASWVIDYSEKAFGPVWGELKGSTVEEITAFVSQYIARKSLRRGFDLASQVAKSREGDCTEHAVFLAACLRHARLSARVMLGVVLVVMNGQPMAFGHAWTEVWREREKQWVVADAAIPASVGAVYLPTAEMVDEGPGFQVALVPGVQALGALGLRLVRR
ncbi:MAG: transglutaminase domain-containing protein [Archangiaceae bacterium]|nr:transglutaminase domain-containing protein [Archangiaceae bacterium]